MLPLVPTLASFFTGFLALFFVAISVFLILVILIQKPKGGGLSGAFGGAGGGSSAVFGAKTGDVLTWFTVGAFVVFLLLGIALVFATRPEAPVVNMPSAGADAPASGAPATMPQAPVDPLSGIDAEPDTPAPTPTPAPEGDAQPEATPESTPTPAPEPAPGPAPAQSPAPADATGENAPE